MKKTHTFALLLVLFTSMVFSACSLNKQPTDPSALDQESVVSETTDTAQPAVDSFVFEATDSDTNALQATQARAEVGLKEYDFGSMVESINGQAATSSHYWALYVNDAYAEAAADQIELTAGDTVRWMYEEIQTGM